MRVPSELLFVLALSVPSLAQTEIYTFPGEPGDLLGHAVAAAGDVDGDGVGDLVVGGHQPATGPEAGVARVYSGADGTVLHTFTGEASGDEFGWSVGGAGDVDDDGRADIVVGAPEADPNGFGSGRAYVFSGADGSLLYVFDGDGIDDNLGLSVDGAGDVDGDGHDDVIVGATVDIYPFEAPDYARVYSGLTGEILLHLQIGNATGKFGHAVAGVGDIDGDGLADVAVGEPFHSGGGKTFRGRIHVVSGADGSTLFTDQGAGGYDFYGHDVDAAGDVDLDGIPDVVAGGWGDNKGGPDGPTGTAFGVVRVLSGADGAIVHELFPGEPGTGWGTVVAGAGDVDGDGYADLATSTLSDLPESGNDGMARILSGRDGALIGRIDGSGREYGWDLAGCGDLTGDGRGDILVGVEGDDTAGSGAGAAFVVAFDGGFVDLGGGIAGAAGVPTLTGSGTLQAETTVTVSLDGAAAGTTTLVLGLTELSAPFKGGVLVPSPDVLLPLPSDVALATTWPPGFTPGFEVFLQAWTPDGAAPAGLSASNALVGHTP